MSTNNTTKKRKVASDDSGISLAAVLAEMQEIKGKLSRMDELESRCISMQNEMDGMKDALSRMAQRNTYLVNTINSIDRVHSSEIHQLENKCELLKRSVKLMSKESTWEYSLPAIPRIYWEDYTDAGITEMEEFLLNIKEITCALRRGEDCKDITLRGTDFIEDYALTFNNILLPHWKEFANALQIYPDTLDQFTLHSIELPSSVLKLLIPALRGKVNITLTLNNNEFTNPREGIEFAVQLIKDNTNISEFEFVNNQVSSAENAHCLVEAIISHPSLKHYVRLENCFRDEGINCYGYDAIKLLFAENKGWNNIDLENNNIKTGGCTAIPDFIATNPPLKQLILENNNFNDEDATLIARALKHNINLEQIHLGDNDITDAGAKMLFKAVYDTTSLNSAADSNHTCQIVGSFSYLDVVNTATVCIGHRKVNRSRKIYYLLSDRNKMESNVHYLNLEFDNNNEDDDISFALKLTPQVLQSIYNLYSSHRNHESYSPKDKVSVPPLSIMYETLRGWKMPELYDNKRGNVR